MAALGFGSLVYIALLTYQRPFYSSSVCMRCGAARQTTEWQLPFTRIAAFRRSSERATPVSLSLTTNHVVAPHSHRWLFAGGGGNGIRCALGRARHVYSTVESAQVAQLIGYLEKYGDRGFRDKLLTTLFDNATTYLVRTLPVPSGGFSDAAQLHEWIAQQSEYFDERVGAFKSK
jgi:hypothetical protein